MIRSTQSIDHTKRVDGRSGHRPRAQRYFCTDRRIYLVSHSTQQWLFSGLCFQSQQCQWRLFSQFTKVTILSSLLYCRPADAWRWFSRVGFTVLQARCAEQLCCTMFILVHCCCFHSGYMFQVVLRVDGFEHDMSWLAGTLWYGPSWTTRRQWLSSLVADLFVRVWYASSSCSPTGPV